MIDQESKIRARFYSLQDMDVLSKMRSAPQNCNYFVFFNKTRQKWKVIY